MCTLQTLLDSNSTLNGEAANGQFNMFEKIRPGRLLVELIVVILGVAIALAADSWREDRELRAQELAYLHAIESDMEKAGSVLDAAYEQDRKYADKMIVALELLQSEEPLSASAERDWTGWSSEFSLALFSVPTGSLQALIGSGWRPWPRPFGGTQSDTGHGICGDQFLSVLDIPSFRSSISKHEGSSFGK